METIKLIPEPSTAQQREQAERILSRAPKWIRKKIEKLLGRKLPPADKTIPRDEVIYV
jgi:hypothetical protein